MQRGRAAHVLDPGVAQAHSTDVVFQTVLAKIQKKQHIYSFVYLFISPFEVRVTCLFLLVIRGCPHHNGSVAVVCLVCPNCGQKFARKLARRFPFQRIQRNKIAIQNVENVAVHAASPPLLQTLVSASPIVILLTSFTSSVFKMPLNLNCAHFHSFMFSCQCLLMRPIVINDPDLQN